MGTTPDIRRNCDKKGSLGVWYQDCVLQGGSLAGGERRAVAVLELVKWGAFLPSGTSIGTT